MTAGITTATVRTVPKIRKLRNCGKYMNTLLKTAASICCIVFGVFAHASGVGGMQAALQKMIPFESISFKYRQKGVVNAPGKDGKMEQQFDYVKVGHISFIPKNISYLNRYDMYIRRSAEPAEGKYALTTGYSESALGGSSRVMARHPNDLVVLEDGAVSKADFYGFTSANSISNGKIYNWADAAMPDVCSIWGLCDGSRRFVWYADMIRDSGADFSVMEIDGVSLVSSPEKEAFFDPKTLFLTKYRIYEIPEEGEKTLSSGIEYSDYVVVSGYHVPTSVKITNYSERGEVTGAAEFSIDPGSIKINDEIEDGMKVAFPIGCVVVDQASGTEYTVTNATNVDKKENIIEGILDGILENSDAAKK